VNLSMQTRTEAHFAEMSWHDNHVHGLQIRSGEHGAGELVLDIDYIVEWLCETDGTCQFRLAPASLTFRDVTDLRIDVDFASVSAALGPFSIGEIRREFTGSPPAAAAWRIDVNWPRGAISFHAIGFTQVLRGPAVVKAEQWLEPAERDPRKISGTSTAMEEP
jgi:hypothetical protein